MPLPTQLDLLATSPTPPRSSRAKHKWVPVTIGSAVCPSCSTARRHGKTISGIRWRYYETPNGEKFGRAPVCMAGRRSESALGSYELPSAQSVACSPTQVREGKTGERDTDSSAKSRLIST